MKSIIEIKKDVRKKVKFSGVIPAFYFKNL